MLTAITITDDMTPEAITAAIFHQGLGAGPSVLTSRDRAHEVAAHRLGAIAKNGALAAVLIEIIVQLMERASALAPASYVGPMLPHLAMAYASTQRDARHVRQLVESLVMHLTVGQEAARDRVQSPIFARWSAAVRDTMVLAGLISGDAADAHRGLHARLDQAERDLDPLCMAQGDLWDAWTAALRDARRQLAAHAAHPEDDDLDAPTAVERDLARRMDIAATQHGVGEVEIDE